MTIVDYRRDHLAEAVKSRLAPLNPFQAAEARSMSEAALQGLVLDMCSRFRVLARHEEIPDWSKPGWPDLPLIGCAETRYAELKREDGEVSADQQNMLTALDLSGVRVHVWRPSDWVSGVIEQEIRAIAGQPSREWIDLYENIREREAKRKLAATLKAQQTRTRNRARKAA